jgi:hypothetical protein
MLRSPLSGKELTYFLSSLTVICFFIVLALQNTGYVSNSAEYIFSPPSYDRFQNDRYRSSVLEHSSVATIQITPNSYDELTGCLALGTDDIPSTSGDIVLELNADLCVVLVETLTLSAPLRLGENTQLSCNSGILLKEGYSSSYPGWPALDAGSYQITCS